MSYLTNQKQYVQVNDKQSTRLPIYFGVPQGSILGLVLLNIYHLDSIQYADDTNTYKSSSKANTTPTMRALENDISELLKWSKYSGLGVTFDQHLTLNEQINTITKSNYNILRILKAFKRFTP